MDDKTMKNQWEVFSTIDEISYNLDCKQLSKALEFFTEDAHLQVLENGKITTDCTNKQAIQDILTQKIETVDILFHNNGTKVIDIKSLDQAATADTTSIAQLIRFDPYSVTWQTMEYKDSLVKVDGNWYIASRIINILSKTVRG